MTILFFTRLFYPHIGGVEKHIYEVGTRLIEKGHKVVIVTERLPNNRGVSPFDLKGFEIHRIATGNEERNKKYKIWKWLWQNRTLIQSADIIHAHDVFFWYLPFRFIYPRKKLYTTFHGFETVYPPRRNAIIIRKISERLSEGNICVGEYIKKWYGTNPDIITYGGVEKMKLSPLNNTVKNKLNILFIGRLEEDTGGYIYSEVLQILTDNNVPFVFTALGDGSIRKVFERWGDVKGFVSNVGPYLHKSDIVFASSYLSILQTFMSKKALFATYDNPLKKDYLEMTPFAEWISIDNDPIQMTHAIMQYRKNAGKYNDKILQAFKWANKQTWEKVTDKYLALWKIK